MIAILDYGMGNVKSIHNMLKKIGFNSTITMDIDSIKNAEKYILPGVGSFDRGIKNLKQSLFFKTLEHEILHNKKPVLGICLGMQLLTNGSEEGVEEGLCWIDAYTKKLVPKESLPVPHMGWNHVFPVNEHPLFKGLLEDNRFYFVHSYHVVCHHPQNILSTATYGGDIVSAIHSENIFGVQFHPEKSHKYGMQLLKNFGEIE